MQTVDRRDRSAYHLQRTRPAPSSGYQGRYLFVNDTAEKVLGWSREQLYGKCDTDIFPPATAAQFRENDHKALTSGTGVLTVETLRHEDGIFHHSVVSKFAIPDREGVPRFVGGLAIDITEHQRAEQSLRASEERLQLAIYATTLGIFEHNHRTDAVYWSPTMREIVGWSADGSASLPAFIALIHPEDRAKIVEAIRLAHDPAGEGLYLVEHRIVRRDGGVRWIRICARTHFEGQGDERRPVRTIGTAADVTEQRQAEERLRESEERFQQLAHHIDGYFGLNAPDDSQFHYVSPGYEKITGRSCASQYQHPESWTDVIHPDDRARVLAIVGEPLHNEARQVEYRIVRPDGAVRWIRDRAFPVRNAAGTVYRVAGIGEDITAQKQAEETLRETSEFTRQVVHTAQEGLAVLDLTFRYTLWNTFMERLSGQPASQVLGKRPWEVFHFLSEATSRPLLEAVLTGVITVVPDMFTTPPAPGRAAWVSQVLVPMRDAAGKVVGVLCSLHDITAWKLAEEARRRLAAIVESAEDAIISKNLDGTITTWNAGAERLLGYSAQEVIGQNIALILPVERQEEEPQFRARIVRGESVEYYETIRLNKSGRRMDVALSVSPVRDATGAVIGCAKIMHDISARKHLEKEVLEIATREQRRIGQELHDTTGQELTALSLLAETLVKTLEGRATAEAVIAGKLAVGFERALDQIRGIARGLLPVDVDSQGLQAALEDFTTRISASSGVNCTLYCGSDPVEVEDNQTATQLFHIAQEAVTNALRHGKPSRIALTLIEDKRALTLRIQDNGVGFPAEPVESTGMGLKIMHYRAGLINGRLTIVRADPVGTVVTCRLFKGTIHEQ